MKKRWPIAYLVLMVFVREPPRTKGVQTYFRRDIFATILSFPSFPSDMQIT